MIAKKGESVTLIHLLFTDKEFADLQSAYEYGKQDNEGLEEYLHRSIVTAAELSKTIRGKTITCF